jgi:type I restriction enzyme S subunit
MLHDLLTRGLDDKGELRDPIRHPEQFKDSPLGKIPKGWKVRSMEELTLKIVDGVHHTPNYVATGIPFIVITDLTSNNRITFQNTRFISEKDHLNFIKRADPQPGDVLVTKDGTLGVARLVPFNAPGFSIFVSVAMLRPNLKECCPDLIRSFFDSDDFLIQLRTLSAGSGLAHIHLEHFRKFQIRRPPIDEQVNIFKITQKQDDLLKNVLDDLKKLNLLKQALMQDLLTGKVRVPENMMEAMP